MAWLLFEIVFCYFYIIETKNVSSIFLVNLSIDLSYRSSAKSRGNCCVSCIIMYNEFGDDSTILICHFSNHRLFDGDETVAFISDKAAGLTHTETVHSTSKGSTEEVK